MPKSKPVEMLARPEKTSVDPKLIEPVNVSAIINGSSVPRSPREPEISASGCDFRVDRLWCWIRRQCERKLATDIVFIDGYAIDAGVRKVSKDAY